MSLIYKIFGKPRTVEDFSRRALKRGHSNVDLEVRECYEYLGSYPHYSVFFKAGETEVMLSRHYSLASAAYVKALLCSVMFAKIIRKQGLSVTVNGESTDKAVRKARELYVDTKKLLTDLKILNKAIL